MCKSSFRVPATSTLGTDYRCLLLLDIQKGTVELSLLAVVVHSGGSILSGHYYAYVLGRDGQSWFKHDDEQVRQQRLDLFLSA